MKIKNPMKVLRILRILSLVIALAAIAVGMVAVLKKEYVIAAAMLVVLVWQVINFFAWKQKLPS